MRRRLNDFVLPVMRWPMLLNSHELAGLSGLPIGDVQLPGLDLSAARQLPAPAGLSRSGTIIAVSNYAGMTDRPLALATRDMLRHTYVVAPTGAGKSWLLSGMILQQAEANRGILAIDVKGDLVADVLARIRDVDAERVIVIDPSKRDKPIGLNVLAAGHLDRELVVDNVLHTLREIWSSSWGPRTDYVIRNALLTLVSTKGAQGDAFTICEVVPLLTNQRFRAELLQRSKVPDNLRTFWQRYDAMSLAEQTQVIGPTLNKLDAFTSRSAIRLMLGQSTGIDLSSVFYSRKIILISLAKGQLGAETANLLGALLVSALWHATLGRVSVPSEQRPATFAYLDEAQDIVRLPVDMADMLAQARGLRLGVVLANQYVAQLPEAVKNAVLGTVRTQIAFQLDHDDARLLERRFAPLSQRDLMGLQEYEIAMRPCVNGRTLSPVTGRTLALEPAVRNPDLLAARSRDRYGVPAAEVEQAIADRQQAPRTSTRFGREDLGSDS
ncbi:MAG: ATP-binding protein [Frankiaceae bacterium]|nr:ATP-binding protein [Frankiaceae bacterium]